MTDGIPSTRTRQCETLQATAAFVSRIELVEQLCAG